MIGLVLTGGGARAAYQVGAIRALADILPVQQSPFGVVAGASAGAINSVAVAIGADDFRRTAARLSATWMSLTPHRVYRTDTSTLLIHGARWLKDLSTGGLFGPSRVNHLLDTGPLRELLVRELDVTRVQKHVDSGLLRGVAVSATNYLTGSTVTFFDGAKEIEPWVRRGRVAVRERLRVDHVLASTAIPVFFPPVEIDGRFYGDGCIRLTTPVAPAIHLGAEKIVAIGIRYARPHESTLSLHVEREARSIPISAVAGELLNAVFLDSLDNDIERVERINRTLSVMSVGEYQHLVDRLRRVPVLALRPSQDLGALAADQHHRFPAALRHLLRGIGAVGAAGWDLVSYLAFQPEYVSKLIELGYDDTLARRAEVEAFFEAKVERAAGEPGEPAAVVPLRLIANRCGSFDYNCDGLTTKSYSPYTQPQCNSTCSTWYCFDPAASCGSSVNLLGQMSGACWIANPNYSHVSCR